MLFSIYTASGEWALCRSPIDGATELVDIAPSTGTGDSARRRKLPVNLVGIAAISGTMQNEINAAFWKARGG